MKAEPENLQMSMGWYSFNISTAVLFNFDDLYTEA